LGLKTERTLAKEREIRKRIFEKRERDRSWEGKVNWKGGGKSQKKTAGSGNFSWEEKRIGGGGRS